MFPEPEILILNHLMHFYGLWNKNSDLNKVPHYFAVNTISYINIATLLLPGLQKTNGSIVAVSSIAGVVSLPRTTLYSGNKYALHGFFDSLRQNLALQGYDRVSITLSVLGLIDTVSSRKKTKAHPIGRGDTRRKPVDECAVALIKEVALRKRQMYFPWYLSIVETVHFFFPEFMESVIQVATNEKPLQDMWKW